MDNLEHGWLVGRYNSDDDKFVGNCICCDEPIYIDDEYEYIYGNLYCSDCAKEKRLEEEV